MNCRALIAPRTKHVRAKTGWPFNEHDRKSSRPSFYFNYCVRCIIDIRQEVDAPD